MRVENAWERLFGGRVKDLRQAKGWTQDELARRMTAAGHPMHQTTVAKLESGTRPTNVGEVAALAAIFGMPIATLFDDSDAAKLVLEAAALNYTMAALADELVTIKKRFDEVGAQRKSLESDVQGFRKKLAGMGSLPRQYADLVEASLRQFSAAVGKRKEP